MLKNVLGGGGGGGGGSLHNLLANQSPEVNGCRQNKSSNSW